MADFSDRDVLTRITQIQAEGGGDNPATRAQIAQEALDAGVNSAQISRALNLAAADAGVESGFNSGGIRVANIASGLGYDLGSTSPLVDLGTISDATAANAALYAGDIGMPSYEDVLKGLYATTKEVPVLRQQNSFDPSGFQPGSSGGGGATFSGSGSDKKSLFEGVSSTVDPSLDPVTGGTPYGNEPTELIGTSTGDLISTNVSQGPLTTSYEPVVQESPYSTPETPLFDTVVQQSPYTAMGQGPLVTALPSVTAADFLYSGLGRQPVLGPVNDLYSQYLPYWLRLAYGMDPLGGGIGSLQGSGNAATSDGSGQSGEGIV